MNEKDFTSLFSKRLRHYLNENNMTQVELANKLGVGTTSIYNWVSGLKLQGWTRLMPCVRYSTSAEKTFLPMAIQLNPAPHTTPIRRLQK